MANDSLLSVKEMSRRFGGVTAVSNLSFDVYHGEILGLIGPNGAGKSTTFNVVSGFYPPSSGRLWFAGEDITHMPPSRISRKGLVRTFQHDSYLAEMTVYDNILIATMAQLRGRADRHRRVLDTAALIGIGRYLDERAGSLPHGTQRLVSLAIAAATRPRLLCLDEPLTGLHQTEVTSAIDVFKRIRDEFKTSILLVEHNMKAVMSICNRIVVLDHGEFLATGTPEDIKKNPAVISAYLGKRS